MKNIKIYLFFLLFLLPISVLAKDTCDPSNIKIESITLEDTKGNIEEVKEASSSGQKINLGLRMNVVGDTASYKIVLKNNSNEDYYFDEKSLNLNKDYVDYEVDYEDGDNHIKSGEEKILFLKVVYKEKMDSSTLENGLYQDTQVVKLNLTNNNLVEEILENPVTGSRFGIIVFIILIIGLLLFFMEKRKSVYLFLLCLIIPLGVQALCRHSLEIENELVIDAREAVFLTGKEVNVKMKQLAGDDTSTVTNAYSFKDEMITSIQYSEAEPDSMNKEEKNIVSTPESEYPIYMWYDNGTIYWWSEDKSPALNEDASLMFNQLSNLSNITGLETFDVSNVSNLNYSFAYNSLTSLDGLERWAVSNITSMCSTFSSNYYLKDMVAIENWNVEKVIDMSGLFKNTFSMEEINFSAWKTNSLENISFIFANGYVGTFTSNLKKIIVSENFNTSKVQNMSFSFYNNRKIEDYSFLQFFDTSSVVNMQDMFYGNFNLLNLEHFKNWDVSNVKNMMSTFTYNPYIKSLDGLENWDVSNVTNMYGMFSHSPLIEDASALNGWDISNVISFENMFFQAKTHPEFIKVQGTWSGGTFTPKP